MIIGNFNYNKAQDTYTGEIATLSGATRKLVFKPSEATGDKVPQYRVLGPSKAGDIEFGAAWKKRSDEGRDYLSVKLDDPALANADQLRAGDVQPRGFPSGVVARQPQEGRLIRLGRGGPQGPPFGSCPAKSGVSEKLS